MGADAPIGGDAPGGADASGDAAAAADAGVDAGAAADAGVDAAAAADAGVDAGPDLGVAASCGVFHETGDLLYDLGHGTRIWLVRIAGPRVLSQDITGHWLLSDTTTTEEVASGGVIGACGPDTGPCQTQVDLVGTTLLARTGSTVELRDSGDAHLLGTVTTTAPVIGLASDGSYLWAASGSGLHAWATDGSPLVNRSGDYAAARIFAVPGELRIATGPAGAHVIELVATSGGTSTTTPAFAGAFHSWFLDGGRFLTNVGAVVRVYTKDAVFEQLVDVSSLQRLTGNSRHFSAAGSIYEVGNNTPVASYVNGPFSSFFPSATAIATWDYGAHTIHIDDLSGASVVHTEPDVPVAYLSSFARDDAGNWAVGNELGVAYDSNNLDGPGGPRALSCGTVLSIAGSTAGKVAIATAAGPVVFVDLQGGTRTLSTPVFFASSTVAMSSDGTIVALQGDTRPAQYALDTTLKVLQLPAGTPINSWPFTYFGSDFALARDGGRIAMRGGTGFIAGSVTGAPDFDQPGEEPIALSPSGTRIALSDHGPVADSTTRIYDNGVLVGAVAGAPVAWLDESRLLVQEYVFDPWVPGDALLASHVVDVAGNVLASPMLPSIMGYSWQRESVTPIDASRLYVPRDRTVRAIDTGAVEWTSSVPAPPINGGVVQSDVAGGFAVSAYGKDVTIEAY